jgi:hypothetical protein
MPTERPPLVDEVSANFLRIKGCRVVSAADSYDRNLVYLDRRKELNVRIFLDEVLVFVFLNVWIL